MTKLDLKGNLLFTSIFGGTKDEFPGGIAVDNQGVYVVGTTDSSDLFPSPAGQTLLGRRINWCE